MSLNLVICFGSSCSNYGLMVALSSLSRETLDRIEEEEEVGLNELFLKKQISSSNKRGN